MKRRLLALLSLLLLLHAAIAELPKHVIFISIDGFRPDFYLDSGWCTPNIHLLMKDGAYAKAVTTVFPSVTYPSHTSIITGVTPAKHGIYYNYLFYPQGGSIEAYRNYNAIRVPTLWDAAKQKGLTVSSLLWPVSVGAPVDYNIQDVGNKGDSIREKTSAPAGFISILKKEVFSKTGTINYNKNQDVARIAAYLINKAQPDLMMVHFLSVDGACHSVGRTGPQIEAAVADADEAIGIIISALKESGNWECTTLFVGGDHGFCDVTRTLSPNTWLKEAGLLNDPAKGDWKAQFDAAGGSTFLYLSDPHDEATEKQVEAMLRAQPDSIRRYFRIISRGQLDRSGANPEVALALTAEQGGSFSDSATGPVIKPGKGGIHGHYPDNPQIHTGLIVCGSGIRKGTVLNQMSILDIAAIIAHLLDLSLPKGQGIIPEGLLIK